MPKLKTHKGASKRFKRTSKGYKHARMGKNHMNMKKSNRRRRALRGFKPVAAADTAKLNRLLPQEA